MTTKKNRDHFTDFREQSRIKHEILSKYFTAFSHILKKYQDNLVYLDAFAGRGTYDDKDSGNPADGSPLRVLKTIADHSDLAEKVTAILIENDEVNFESLQQAVSTFHASYPKIKEPVLLRGTFAEHVSEILDELEKDNCTIAPTFLFVDPCGISGASLSVISRFMSNDRCEAFIFFNVDGLNRVCGLTKLSKTVIELYGNKDRAENLVQRLRCCDTEPQKVEAMISLYTDAIKEDMGSEVFVTPFGIEHANKRMTSHYLVHVTKHPLGFRIMKDVMWRLGTSIEGTGDLGLVQASKYDGTPLLRPTWESFKQSIEAAVRKHPMTVKTFYQEWTARPTDRYSEQAYREALLELEKEERITVLDKDGKAEVPARKRRTYKGNATLGPEYWLR